MMQQSIIDQSLEMLNDMIAELQKGQREEAVKQIVEFAQKPHPQDKRVLNALSAWAERERSIELKSIQKLLRTFFDAPEEKQALLRHIQMPKRTHHEPAQEMTLSLVPVAEVSAPNPDQEMDKAVYLDCLRRELFTKLYGKRPRVQQPVSGPSHEDGSCESFTEPSQDVVEKNRDKIRQRALESFAVRQLKGQPSQDIYPDSPASIQALFPRQHAKTERIRIGQRTALDEFLEARRAAGSKAVSRAETMPLSGGARLKSQTKRPQIPPQKRPPPTVQRTLQLREVRATSRGTNVQDFGALVQQTQTVISAPIENKRHDEGLELELRSLVAVGHEQKAALALQMSQFDEFQRQVERILQTAAPRKQKEAELKKAAHELRPQMTPALLRALRDARRGLLDVAQYGRYQLEEVTISFEQQLTQLVQSSLEARHFLVDTAANSKRLALSAQQRIARARAAHQITDVLASQQQNLFSVQQLRDKLQLLNLLSMSLITKRRLLRALLSEKLRRVEELPLLEERAEELRIKVKRTTRLKDRRLGYAE